MGLAQEVTQTVESTVNERRDYRMAGDFSINEALMLEGSLSASLVSTKSIDSKSRFVSWIKNI